MSRKVRIWLLVLLVFVVAISVALWILPTRFEAALRAEVNELLLSCPLSPRFRVFLLSHATVSRFTPQNHPDRVLEPYPFVGLWGNRW